MTMMMTMEEILLLNLSGEFEEDEYAELNPVFMGQYSAYCTLRDGTGKDFGYDVIAWKEWLETHPGSYQQPGPRVVDELLNNLTGYDLIFDDPTDIPGYLNKEDAYQRLKDRTGQDFGYDTEKWRSWFLENQPSELGFFPRGFQPKKH